MIGDGHNLNVEYALSLIKKYEKQSDNVKNSREFEALNKEIEMQQLEEKLCEKHIKDATEEISDKARQLELAKKAVSTKETNLNGKKAELEKIGLTAKVVPSVTN